MVIYGTVNIFVQDYAFRDLYPTHEVNAVFKLNLKVMTFVETSKELCKLVQNPVSVI